MQTIVAIFPNRTDAENAITELISSGIKSNGITYIARKLDALEAATTDGEENIGGLAVPIQVIPGWGALFLAGPLADNRGPASMLVGAGANPEEVKTYEDRLRAGDVLLSTRTGDMQSEDIKTILLNNNGEEIHAY